MNEERYATLLMKAVDGLLSAEEKAELDAHLERFPACREEFDDFVQIKESTDAMRARIRESGRQQRLAGGPVWSTAAYLLLFAGVAGSIAIAVWEFLHSDAPTASKLASGAIGLGLLGLFTAVLIPRLRHKDPYSEIDQ